MATAAKTTKMERVEAILAETPDLPTAEIAAKVGCDPGTVARAKARLAEKANEPVEIDLASIDLDSGTQMRPEMDSDREKEFTTLMAEGVEFDPVEVYEVAPGRYVLTDGFHRVAAALGAELETICAIVRRGTLDDARRAAARANSRGTLPRCPETCRRAVWAIIELDGPDRTVGHYAAEAGVNGATAGKYHQAYLDVHAIEPSDKVTGRDGKQYPARKTPKSEPEPARSTRVVLESNGHAETVATFDPGDVPFDDDLIPDDAEVGHVKPVMPDPAERAKARQIDDEEWLSDLCRDTGKPPVRDRLPREKRAAFDQDALIYRALHDSGVWPSFASLAKSLTGDGKAGGERGGAYAGRLRSFRLLKHPRDWVMCYSCSGKGCESCKNNGYTLG